MISYSKISGTIKIINIDSGVYTVILDSYIGSIEVDSEVCGLKFIVYSDNTVTSPINIVKNNKLDKILVTGPGNLSAPVFETTCLDIQAHTIIGNVRSNVVKVSGSTLEGLNNVDNPYISTDSFDTNVFVSASGHIWLIDCIFNSSGYTYGITSPYVLLDNATCNIHSEIRAIESDNDVRIQNCSDTQASTDEFESTAEVLDSDNIPKPFVYTIVRNEFGEYEKSISRRQTYGHGPAVLADKFDTFQDATGYTNPNLHRRIDQNGEILKSRPSNYITDYTIGLIVNGYHKEFNPENEGISDEVILEICNGMYVYDGHPHYPAPISADVIQQIIEGTYIPNRINQFDQDEVESRKYEVGIYSLKSYRTTTYAFHDESSEVTELP